VPDFSSVTCRQTRPKFRIMTKYERWYAQIIIRARDRKLDIYKEKHHILPRALGGEDDDDNLVDLTYREHFLVHWLLTKITVGRGRWPMLYALHCMTMSSEGRLVAGWQVETVKRVFKQEKIRKAQARLDRIRATRSEWRQLAVDNASKMDETLRGRAIYKDLGIRQVRELADHFLAADPRRIRRHGRHKSEQDRSSDALLLKVQARDKRVARRQESRLAAGILPQNSALFRKQPTT
jgi:hypothetical protein